MSVERHETRTMTVAEFHETYGGLHGSRLPHATFYGRHVFSVTFSASTKYFQVFVSRWSIIPPIISPADGEIIVYED
jgi:hypothetical protein